MHKSALPQEGTETFKDQIRIILVETSHSGNIGAVARAMKNMGLGNLWLVNPSSFPDEASYARAAGASDVLDSAHVVSSLDEALADCVLVMGTSARGRKVPWPVCAPPEAAAAAAEHAGSGPVAMVFGRENHGLSNDELQRCHYHIHIPSNPDYSSLNLAMAVQVMCYELRMYYLRSLEGGEGSPYLKSMTRPGDEGWDVPPAKVHDVEGFFGHLEQVLIDVDFHRRENPRQLMTRLRRLFQRARLDQMEINILRGILTAVQKASGTRNNSKSTEADTAATEQDNGHV
ncbi:tRNA (cytosine(32)/uridine(32)-2'-O)-methyltransferase TrmJ [Marinobacter sp. UBA2498]|jgi:tRNA (cytidine32/uridine32-2'-O)-methyltransferase|uniref:tRNA (cytidine/uridine-2'-O-)-methyltransferase TrmJ n=1 Tax=Marinobacter adhaerens TaxID=1033846 RepID=A0A352IZ79_9GAMM|nr:tRNA (cytosine(32)/uridine(32)-2'-O)-methyltransferase TrmJ [Marinobacter sp. UBA2498]MAM52264.1 tRNA (cytosine(32)/uridine(32)-2'-O)-methyltransferase TrmJ [Marinobacter sp.]HBC36762.1 tRNA (cytosine(32)/uridine(32)-2'-O)-methyltransferase TrmJ [Marinobacter adhaerens]|tara:strand:- start:808 stop:1671 length:864 start_codon:yes stop_codon:yes gene_type:complete